MQGGQPRAGVTLAALWNPETHRPEEGKERRDKRAMRGGNIQGNEKDEEVKSN